MGCRTGMNGTPSLCVVYNGESLDICYLMLVDADLESVTKKRAKVPNPNKAFSVNNVCRFPTDRSPVIE